MNAEQIYDPKAGSANDCGLNGQNAPQTGLSTTPAAPIRPLSARALRSAAYGSWPLFPPLHQPTATRPDADPATLAAMGQSSFDSVHERFVEVLDRLGLTGYAIAKHGPVSTATISNIRAGRVQPSTELLCWLVATYPQVNLDYLLREEGEPLTLPVPVVDPAARLTGEQLGQRLGYLRERLRGEVYAALLNNDNLLFDEEGDVVVPSEQALAVNLHREFVTALGSYQGDWMGEYWAELGYLFGLLFSYSGQVSVLLSDRVFLSLLHSFAA